jgi:hypothetical protein
VAFVAFAVAILGSGSYGTLVALRERRFAAALEPGGLPVELRRLASSVPAVEQSSAADREASRAGFVEDAVGASRPVRGV